MTETRRAALLRGRAQLAEIDGGARDAAVLLRWALGISAAALSAHDDDVLSAVECRRFDEALARRARREPVSHIVGGREFWGRWFRVTADVLDPRPETEILIAAALETPFASVLDLGVGSACLLGTALAERPAARGVGVDRSEAALRIAADNLDRLGLAGRAELRAGNWAEGLAGAFDLVLCNPPYIAEGEMASLAPELSHEPRMALTPGGDGLAPYRAIAPLLPALLTPNGRAIFEIGPTQAPAVAAIFAAHGWPAPDIRRDFDGRDRCLIFSANATNSPATDSD